MNTETILEVQSELEIALQSLPGFQAQLPDVLKPLVKLAPPKGVRACVSLRHAGKKPRQVKRNAPADSWSASSGLVSISYSAAPREETADVETQAPTEVVTVVRPQRPRSEDPARELLRALARAENDPQLGFVSLKWFRDTYLPQQGSTWAAAPENRQRVLAETIENRWILTSKVPNPKNPQYPVTAIRINRPLPEVREMLEQEGALGSDFAPIAISGERLSETVLRERR